MKIMNLRVPLFWWLWQHDYALYSWPIPCQLNWKQNVKHFPFFPSFQLSNNNVDENSDVDTVVGMLSTADQDNGQTYTYSMLDGAGGRFKIQSNLVKVSDRQ